MVSSTIVEIEDGYLMEQLFIEVVLEGKRYTKLHIRSIESATVPSPPEWRGGMDRTMLCDSTKSCTCFDVRAKSLRNVCLHFISEKRMQCPLKSNVKEMVEETRKDCSSTASIVVFSTSFVPKWTCSIYKFNGLLSIIEHQEQAFDDFSKITV